MDLLKPGQEVSVQDFPHMWNRTVQEAIPNKHIEMHVSIRVRMQLKNILVVWYHDL